MATAAFSQLAKPTSHVIHQGDARELDWVPSESVHLVATSPPYWTLKEYPLQKGQLGLIADYDAFHDELEKVWRHCLRILVPGGRLVCVRGRGCLPLKAPARTAYGYAHAR